MIKKIFKTLNQMEKLRDSEYSKLSLAMFPLVKFLKSRYDFKTGANMRSEDAISTLSPNPKESILEGRSS